MNTTVISVKIDKQTKVEAQKLAEKLGFSLSSIIKAQLKHFVRSKRVDVALTEEPTEYLLKSLKQSDEDIKAGRVTSFHDIDEALEFLDHEIKHGKHKTTAR